MDKMACCLGFINTLKSPAGKGWGIGNMIGKMLTAAETRNCEFIVFPF